MKPNFATRILISMYKFAKKHPWITYGGIALPACFLMCTGAQAIHSGFYEKED